jgi:hypothetical protein
MILGGGPNRIGQGIEFDYCCVHASQALRNLAMKPLWLTATLKQFQLIMIFQTDCTLSH